MGVDNIGMLQAKEKDCDRMCMRHERWDLAATGLPQQDGRMKKAPGVAARCFDA